MDSKSTKNNFKIISIALIISILLQVLMPIMIPLKSFAATDEEPYIIKTQYNQIIKFTSKVHEMKAGDIVPVEVEVTVSNLLSLSVNLIYDKEIFEIVNVDYYEDTTQNIKWQQAGFAEQGEEGQFIYARSYGEKPTSGTFVLMTINLKVKETVQGTLDSANLQFKYVTPEDSENSTDMGPNGDGNGYEKEIELPVPLKTTDITYNANVPEGVETPAENVPETGKKEEGTPYTIAAGPTLPGYRFIEWNIAQSGNGGAYKAGTEYTTDTALTLYAQWVKEYTLTLDADGGTYEGDREIKGIKDEIKQIPAPTTAPEGHTITLNMNDGTANPATEELKQEKTFEKWERTEGVGTADGRIFTFGEGNATAKAIYKSEKVPLTVPTRSGYEFKGWYTTADPTQGEKVDMSYMPEGNVTLYASWEKVEEEDLRHTLTINAGEGTYIGETERKGLTNAIIQIGEAKAPKGHTIKINPNNGEAITQVEQKQSFDKWEKTGAGAVNGTAFTFGEGNAEVTAKYKLDKVELQEPENKGYEIEGWYTTTNEELNPETDTKIDPSNYIPEQDETVYPNWVEKEYKITYNNTKDSNNTENPTKYTVNSGTLEIKNLADQERYTFKGWYLTAEGTGEKITSINVEELENLEDIQLYAQWEEQTTVKIKYNANGENVQNVPAEVTQDIGTTYRIAAAPTREGYKFMGWCIRSDGADLTYQPGNSYKANEDLELYAIWERITSTDVDITYNANVPEAERDNVQNMPENTTKAEGAVHTIPATVPTREGYVFKEWNKSKDGDQARYNPGDKYEEDVSLTLFAQWEKEYTLTVNPDVETYEGDREVKGVKDDIKQIPAPTVAPEGHTVTLNMNDGTANPATEELKQEKAFDKWEKTGTGAGEINGEVFTFGEGNAEIKAIYKSKEVELTIPTREGYIFKGWYTTADPAQGEKVDMSYMPEEDVTLYASWEEEAAEQYTLTIKAAEGTYEGEAERKGTAGAIIQIGEAKAPKGHTIKINPNNGEEATQVEQSQSFDKWEKTGAGEINGTVFTFGEGNAEVTAKYKLDKVEIPTLEKEGYEIEGWYTTTNEELNPETDTKIDPSNYIPEQDETVYPNWVEKEYKITYRNIKGSDNSQNPEKYTINSGTLEIKNLADQEKYTFKGWYLTEEGTGEKITSINVAELENLEDIELYAQWEEIQITEVKIKYNANGENVQNVPAEVTQEKGTIYRIAAAPTREGYKFMGWCITADGADLTYQPGNSYKANEDLELYAIWAKITTTEVEIKYEKNVPEAEVNTVSNMPNNTTKAEGAVHTIPEAIPTREGYVFAGWNISKDGDKAGYNPGSKYTEDANLTLFAQWEKEYTLTVDPDVETYEGDREVKGIKDDLKQIPAPTVAPEGHTVTLNINDGTQNPTETTVKQTKTFDKWERTTGVGTVNGEVFTFGEGNATIKAIYKLDEVTPEVPTRAGYIFKGWYTTADPRQGEKVDMPFVPEEDITIYADWEKEPEEEVQYTLTVKPNGGTYIGDTEIKGAYNSTKQIGIPSEAPKGHTIIIDTNNGQTATEVEQTQSFDKWERTSGVGTVNGTAFKFGEGNAEVTAKYKLDKVELGTPEKTGYEIEGWYTTSTPTATPNPETDTKIDPENYIPTKDEKVYVNWKEKEYKITYNNTKDSDISQHPLKYTIKDETIELKDLPDQEKYIFKGWYATAEGTGEKITSIDISKLEKMEDIELYAKWEEKEPETETLYLKSAKYKVGEKDIDNYEKGDVYLDKIEPLTTVAKLKENCEHNGTLTVLDAQGQALKDDDLVGTGMTIRVEGHNDKFELTAVVMGDLDGNGKVTATDLSALNQAILKEITLEGASFKAADLDDSEKITATDLSTINNVILKNLVLTFIKKIS